MQTTNNPSGNLSSTRVYATAAVVTPDNAKEQIERRLSDLVDLLAFYIEVKIDPRAWAQLLVYAPDDVVAARRGGHARSEATDEIERLRNGIRAFIEGEYPNPRKERPGKCRHGIYYYDECGQCNDDYLTKLLSHESNEGQSLRKD